MITATGLGSGLDIQGLVDGLVAAERAGSDLQLNRQSARLQSKFSALGTLKGALSTFQSSLSGINSLATFTRNTATSSNSATLGASADSSAAAGSYSVLVNQLATAHSLASPLITSDRDVEVGTGTLTFRFGSTDYDSGSDTYGGFVENPETSSASVVIDSSNNSLQGIMTAINEADIGVNASVVFDGTGYRLLMSSSETGLANSLQISVADDDSNNSDLAGLSQLAFNASATNMDQTVAAQDAGLNINGLAITSSSNEVDAAVQGLTLSLAKADAAPVQVTVAPDDDGVKTAVNAFVDGYNQFIAVSNSLSAYNPDTRQAAALVGDFTLRSVQGQINGILRSSLPADGSAFSTLVDLGITTTGDGSLTLDEARLNEALAANPERVQQLFSEFGASSGSQITYLGASSLTAEGVYPVEVTAQAQAGFYTGASVLPGFVGIGSIQNVTIDDDNDEFTVAIDGVEAAITLTQGLYTDGDSLAAEVQSQINGASPLSSAGLSVTVAYDSGSNNLLITSDSTGSDSTVDFVSVDADTASTLGFSIGTGTEGTDLQALIGGVAAIVNGDILEAAAGTAAEGLRIQLNSTTIGSKGTVSFARGVASQLDSLLDGMLDIQGSLNDRIGSLEDRLEGVEDRRQQLELRWEAVRERYTRQFNALDSLIGQLEGTSAFLEQQLSGLQQLSTRNNG